jgi:hypothetical protein
MEEHDDEVVDTSPRATAEALTATMSQAGQSCNGPARSWCAWLGHSTRSSVSSGKVNNGESEERPDVLFYDVPDSACPKVDEERFIVE